MPTFHKTAIGLVVVGILLSLGSVWVAISESKNPHGHRIGARSCAECHVSDVPRVHTNEFVETQHMTQAYLNWRTCTTCHWENSCNSCHEKEESAPAYHTSIFKDVASEGRMEHVLHARMHPESCMVCHTHQYAKTCGQCHSASGEGNR